MAINEMTAGFDQGAKVRIVNPDTKQSIEDEIVSSDSKFVKTKSHPDGHNNWVRKNATGGKLYHMNDPWHLELREDAVYHAKRNGLNVPLCGTRGTGDRYNVVSVPAKDWNELDTGSRCRKCSEIIAKKKALKEDGEVPTNAVGTGHIAGASPGQEPPMPRRKQKTYAEKGAELQQRYIGNVRKAMRGPGLAEGSDPAGAIFTQHGWKKVGRHSAYDIYAHPSRPDQQTRVRRPGIGQAHTQEYLSSLKSHLSGLAEGKTYFDFVRLLYEGWVRGSKKGHFSAEASEMEHHDGPIHCPGCGAEINPPGLDTGSVLYKANKNRDNELTHWEAKHDLCGTKLTVFND